MNRLEQESYKAKLAEANCAQQTTPTPMGIGAAYYGDECKALPARESLSHQLRHAASNLDNASKALRILEAHPEFEDLIWLMRSGLI